MNYKEFYKSMIRAVNNPKYIPAAHFEKSENKRIIFRFKQIFLQICQNEEGDYDVDLKIPPEKYFSTKNSPSIYEAFHNLLLMTNWGGEEWEIVNDLCDHVERTII